MQVSNLDEAEEVEAGAGAEEIEAEEVGEIEAKEVGEVEIKEVSSIPRL